MVGSSDWIPYERWPPPYERWPPTYLTLGVFASTSPLTSNGALEELGSGVSVHGTSGALAWAGSNRVKPGHLRLGDLGDGHIRILRLQAYCEISKVSSACKGEMTQ